MENFAPSLELYAGMKSWDFLGVSMINKLHFKWKCMLRIKRDARSISFSPRFISFPFPRIVCVLSIGRVGGTRAMRAQNFNYLRKISIDPWREIERPAMKREWKAEIQTARRRGARDKAGGRVKD